MMSLYKIYTRNTSCMPVWVVVNCYAQSLNFAIWLWWPIMCTLVCQNRATDGINNGIHLPVLPSNQTSPAFWRETASKDSYTGCRDTFGRLKKKNLRTALTVKLLLKRRP